MKYSIKAPALAPFLRKTILHQYAASVPEELRGLDHERYDALPARVAKRKEDDGDVFLSKEEVVGLVEWKLKHGTFRPKLLQMVTSNPATLIESTTRQAFAILSSPSSTSTTPSTNALTALKTLTTALKGIGPATASLILSIASPARVPFFSDELWRWVMWDEASQHGWRRPITYSAKVYGELFARVSRIVEDAGGEVQAVELEKVAWVLGRKGVDVDGGVEVEDVEETESGEVEKIAKVLKGTKRKVVETNGLAEGPRRSSRLKTKT
ncbi:hypothetical protein P280DRAFT_488714 [Massarina eburnea CBS 473.64]|uniref:Uncharacterized protein n=1 Tax=Massarina eburnea CBS 473.64 TaxID=1395130 RepID=A0A6A6S5C1_9PLEO|nr:hypothetical protein P280DRAFT_488714 [Massarina eburnea CBS 473.64]